MRLATRERFVRIRPAHLRRDETSRLTNCLYGCGGLRWNHLVWYWQTAAADSLREYVTLAADDASLQIALDGDVVGLQTPQLDWRSCSGQTRLLAWTVCHEPLIELLRAVFRRDWVPTSMASTDPHDVSLDLRAGFAVQRADGSVVATGVAAFAAHWAEMPRTRPDFCEPRRSRLHLGVSAQLAVVIDECTATPADVAQIARDSIVRLDNRTLATQPRIQIRAGAVHWLANVSGVSSTVVGRTAPDSPFDYTLTGERTMSEDRSTERALDLGALPVRLTFHAGRLLLPFGALAQVGAGYVFELDRQLDDQVITVHANDTPIAVGELVAIGDLVGVRITRMLPA
jgi:flagellar motor switch/type III secretory pathway protein FliN